MGLLAILLWGLKTPLLRLTSTDMGATLGPAIVYTLASVLLLIVRRPPPLRRFPRRYLFIGGLLFVFYETAMAVAIGLSNTHEQAVEVSLVNYLWPTMMVLLASALATSGGLDALPRVLPGALIALVGVMLAVGGNSGLDVRMAAEHIGANPLPYLLAFMGAMAWSVYAVLTPLMARGMDATSVFFPPIAVSLWVIHLASGEPWSGVMTSPGAWLNMALTAIALAAAYGSWGYGILHGSVTTLALASNLTPVLSVIASAVILRLTLSLWFWFGTVLVVAGSVLTRRTGNRATA